MKKDFNTNDFFMKVIGGRDPLGAIILMVASIVIGVILMAIVM